MTSTRDPEARGTVQRFKDAKGRAYWRARITLPDGERLWVGGRFPSEMRAKEYADEKAREAERRDVTIAKMAPTAKAAGETCDAWRTRYLEFCAQQGMTTVPTKRYRWHKWISPAIGGRTPASITRDDIENVRDSLDKAIREGALGWKTAQNAWNELTVTFREMASCKRRDLRVTQADPTRDVQPPERGNVKAKCYP